MNKLKDIEIKAIYRALISKDYPPKMSKSFVAKVMEEIKLVEKFSYPFGKAVLRFASIFVFAVLTLYVFNYQDNNIEYTKSDFQVTSPTQTENVSNDLNSCVDKKDLSSKEEKSCE